ncbi:ThuA domain-containing protein [Micromonospora sp. CPCC 205556]|uniref:ThuA domain-containing protein n=1 Tax=Micromonospora sp. CPCC 205556 TaxID=3122398 RepID=UPI002FF3CE73
MRRMIMGLAAAALLTAAAGAVPAQAADPAYQVLVFSKTAGYRHASIANGLQAIRDLGAANNFTVTATEDAAAFTTGNLAQFEAVVFLNTTGDVLNATQQTAFESYINGGGGYVGTHSAADTEYNWPFYGQLVGAWLDYHASITQANITAEDRAHAATAHLGKTWTRTDEWYNYLTNPRSSVHVLASLDESSFSGGNMGDHPIAWCKTVGNGRSFYTGGGHTAASFGESGFRTHLLGGIRYAAGFAKHDCRPENGYTTLYNGSTTGWSQAGGGGFTNSNATLKSYGEFGTLWYSARQFEDYSLKLDWMMDGDDNSGVMIGYPTTSTPGSYNSGAFEIQIDATDAADRTTGAVYRRKAADTAARDAALNPPGSWNTYELLVQGERVQVFLNGVKINDYTNTDASRTLRGYIGLQNHGVGDDVSFRNVRIKELDGDALTVEGESYTSSYGVQRVAKTTASGGDTLGRVRNGYWAGYSHVSTVGRTGFSAVISSGGLGGTITIRSGSQTGPVLGTVQVPVTGGWETFQTVSTTLNGTGTGPLILTFSGGDGPLFNIDTLTVTG